MGAAPAQGSTLGYVSDPFRTEKLAPTLKGAKNCLCTGLTEASYIRK